jgi:hypothetical protein
VRGVDLRITADAVAGLTEPRGATPAERVGEPGVRPSRWHEIVDMLFGRPRHEREWRDEE